MLDHRPVYRRSCKACGSVAEIVDYREEGPKAIAVRHLVWVHGIGGEAIMGVRPNFEKVGLKIIEIKEGGKINQVVL